MTDKQRKRQDQKNNAYRKWYANPINAKKASVAAAKRRKLCKYKIKQYLSTLLTGKVCVQCGFSDIRALHYHHINPELKLFCISNAVKVQKSIKAIDIEIAKCELLCANCHLIHHNKNRELA